ncbi:MAG: hypothetical protein FJ271_22330 [Planctomycetes bacterium]|nr:hypothetical protein [Planctomycetota bacterium]
MVGRELTFGDKHIQRFLKDNFILVAADDWYQRRRRDAEGEFFRKVANQGPRKGIGGATRQGIYVLTASGILLGYKNNQDPAIMYDYFRKAHQAWRSLPDSEREPNALKVGDSGKPDRAYHRAPPDGGLIVNVYTRILDRDADGTCRVGTCRFPGGQRASQDHLWLTKEDWQSLIPATPRQGETLTIPERLALRIARFHLVDNTRGEPPFWSRGQVRSGGLKITVTKVAKDGIRLRVDGAFLLADGQDADRARRGYDARLLGHIHYDPAKKAITRFDMIALGDHWGEGPFTGGARPGRSPLGVAFELAAGNRPADRVPPQAARDWGEYLAAER